MAYLLSLRAFSPPLVPCVMGLFAIWSCSSEPKQGPDTTPMAGAGMGGAGQGSSATGGSDGSASGGTEQDPGDERPSEGEAWELVELPGAVCADGSPYPIFVRHTEGATGLALTFEPGGACWDYETCVGRGDEQRAFYLDGIRADHMVALPPPLGDVEGGIPWGLMFPHLGISDRSVPTAGYNHVYFPYCTGDAFLGDLVAVYESADGSDAIEIQHRGAHNVELARQWLVERFASPDHLLVMGASAGALGSTMHYALLREALGPKRASLINDSGPIFPPGGPQGFARRSFAQRYRTDAFTQRLDEALDAPSDRSLSDDSGYLIELLARKFTEDRFLVTYFLSDLNYSIFSYAGFYEDDSRENLLALWAQDTELLRSAIEKTNNWGYFLPGFRADNCSHTVTLLPALEFERLGYVSSVLRGSADGYLRTDLGAFDFGDALESALDFGAGPLREVASEAGTDFSAEDEAYCLRWLD